MANQWFRLYHEFASDTKVQMMSETDQRRLIMLMCLRCCNGDETFHETEIAFHMRISVEEWRKTKAVFLSKKFIDEDNRLLNWNKRQFVSDSSTERVRKYRQKSKKMKQGETFQKRSCNGPDTEADTDIPPISPKGGTGYDINFERWWKCYPKKVGKDAAYRAWKKTNGKASNSKLIEAIKKQIEKNHFRGKDGSDYIPNPATWLNQGRYQDEIENNSSTDVENTIGKRFG